MRKILMALAAAAVGVVAPAGAAPQNTHHISVVFDTSGSLRPGRPAVIETVQTLAWSLVLASEGRARGDVTMSLAAYTDRVEAMHVDGKAVFDVADWPTAAAGMGAGNGAIEDGYLGIAEALLDHPRDAPGHILFISDEDRDQGSGHTHSEVLTTLHRRDIVLDAFVAVRVVCGDGRRALGMTHKGVGYLLDEAGQYAMCTDARPVRGQGTTVGDYVALAFASGGSVWDVTTVSRLYRRRDAQPDRQGETMEAIAQGYTSVVLNRLRWEGQGDQFLAKPLITPAVSMVGQAVNLDGRLSRAVDSGVAVFGWEWDVGALGAPDYSGPEAFHTFDSVGLHPVRLTVSGPMGQTDARTVWVQVRAP